MTTLADQIGGILEAKADALIHRRPDKLAALIDDAFIYINASGMIFDKASYIDAFCVSGRIVFTSQRFSDLRVRQFDGFAVASLHLDDEFRMDQQSISASYRSLCVFSPSGADWRWAAGQTATRR